MVECRRLSAAQTDPEGPIARVRKADAGADAKRELVGHRVDHSLVHADAEGKPACLGVRDARTPESVVNGTRLRIDDAHAVELFAIHNDILIRTTDNWPTLTLTGQPRNGNVLRDAAWLYEGVVRRSVHHCRAGRVLASKAPKGCSFTALLCPGGFLNLINNGQPVILNK